MSDANPRPKTLSRFFWALAAAGVLARVVFLTSASLWNDETSTLVIARVPLRGLLGQLDAMKGFDSTPPLHFILAHMFLKVCPDGLLALRLLSLLCGAAGLALFWLLARRLCPGRALAPMALACAASSWIHASQDGRCYSLVLLLAIFDLILAWDLAREWSARKAAGLAVVASLGLCAHYHFGFLVAGNAVFFALTFRRRAKELALRLATLIPPAAVTACLLPLARSQAASFSAVRLLPSTLGLPQLLGIMGQWLFDPSFLGLAAPKVMEAAGLFSALAIAGAAIKRGGRSTAIGFFMIYAATAFTGLRLSEWVLATPLTQARYLLFLSPLFFCALTEALALYARPLRLALSSGLATLVLSGTCAYYFAIVTLDPHLGGLAQRIRALPGRPPIVHLQSFYYLPLRYYYLPEYRHLLVSSQAARFNGGGLPGGAGLIDDAALDGLGPCLVIDPNSTLFPARWGRARGRELARALRVAAR